jgi:hypothetical protein
MILVLVQVLVMKVRMILLCSQLARPVTILVILQVQQQIVQAVGILLVVLVHLAVMIVRQ